MLSKLYPSRGVKAAQAIIITEYTMAMIFAPMVERASVKIGHTPIKGTKTIESRRTACLLGLALACWGIGVEDCVGIEAADGAAGMLLCVGSPTKFVPQSGQQLENVLRPQFGQYLGMASADTPHIGQCGVSNTVPQFAHL